MGGALVGLVFGAGATADTLGMTVGGGDLAVVADLRGLLWVLQVVYLRYRRACLSTQQKNRQLAVV
jgi:hypothetical protein